ncbi:MAG TPA: hypothetical protein PLF13_03275 [candidate division Zixibacteria bacterium]|nr:hypothetical protein [candidate division Zixibacteria bacterium]
MTSIVEFARKFTQLKAYLSRYDEADMRLLKLIEFRKDHRDDLAKQSHASYANEWQSLFDHQFKSDLLLVDLLPHELESILDVCRDVGDDKTAERVTTELVRKLLYVGEIEHAMTLLNDNESVTFAESDSPLPSFDEYELAVISLAELPPGSKTADTLGRLVREWRLEREMLSYETVRCLFVDRDNITKATGRGRMRTLVCKSAEWLEKQETDEVVFDNQPRSKDDPFVGAAYAALEAAAPLIDATTKAKRKAVRVHLSIEDSSRTFTGDSIALAVALVSYVYLMKPQIQRQERFLPCEVAVTGSIIGNGLLQAVNAGSLSRKIERAFFSPVKYVVVPRGNENDARACVEQLRERYPCRRLRIVAHDHLRDVIQDHNIVRPEKICLTPFVARKARKYIGSVKVQVPLLMGLSWLLLALLWPRFFNPLFDGHITSVTIEENRVVARNSKDETIFVTAPLGFEVLADYYADPVHSATFAVDLDGNGIDELFFSPQSFNRSATVRLYRDNGTLTWEYPATVRTRYGMGAGTNGSTLEPVYGPARLYPWSDSTGKPHVISASFASFPSRDQIRLFGKDGPCDSTAYIHTGVVGLGTKTLSEDLDNDGTDEVIIPSVNNIYGLGILVLNPENLCGVSPPWDNDTFLVSGEQRGSQVCYVRLPSTPLSSPCHVYSVGKWLNRDPATKQLSIQVGEGMNTCIGGERKASHSELPNLFFTLDSNMIPIGLEHGDGDLLLLNQWLHLSGKDTVSNWTSLRDSMLSEVIVYYRDSIVHHTAAGIDFYDRSHKNPISSH